MRKRSNPSQADGGAKGLAMVGVAAVVIIVLAIVGVATDWTFGIGGDGGGGGGGGGGGHFVEMETSKGTFTIELFTEETPLTTANFEAYVRSGYFEGTIFHRVDPTFVIQGGGFTPELQKKPGQRAPIALEAQLPNDERTLAMARTDAADSATSEFFINLKDNDFLNPAPGNDGYAVFGKVVDGWDVVEKIAATPTEYSPILSSPNRPDNSLPQETIVIERVEFVGDEPKETRGFELYAFNDTYGVAPGGIVSFPVVVRNNGNVPIAVNLTADFGGWEGALEQGHVDVELAPDGGDVNLVGMQAPENATGEHTVTVTATPDEGEAQTLEFTIRVNGDIGPERIGGSSNNLVQVRYVGFLENGRVFDTNMDEVAMGGYPGVPSFSPATGKPPLKVNVDEDPQSEKSGYGRVLDPFREGLYGLAEDETAALRVPKEQAYPPTFRDIGGKNLIFMVQIVSIDGTA